MVGELQALLENHGLMLVFLNVLVEQAGLPVPAYPMLFVAGALGMQETGPSIGAVLAAVIFACLIADTGWYFAGRRLGQPMLRTICRVSISQDSCIRQTQSLYLRVGPRSLVIAKLLPGAGALSTAMAGMTGTPLPVFLFYDAIGALVWAGSALLIGVVFSDFIDAILEAFSAYGHMAVVGLLVAFALFLAWRWWRRFRLLRRTRRVPRMTVDELEARRLAGSLPVVIDVRAHGDTPMERIPGSVVLDMQGALDSLDALGVPHAGADIVVYCACPNELSAALLAERLRVAGYPKTWALAGGFDEWKRRHGGTAPTEAANQPGPAEAA
ncbi:Rhodanese-related sulfurtransferase [Cupriavidus necator]|uniref:Thiosulfate sulfurtransferase n=1 Tax=Cupriavidus necator (strain ATCC 17699 / DSM 428 / KCTC 22496 / NCIMB 10442 / H16 / Stanier 337) TaxID=381666 RepID=Q0K4Y6_CUPNH|nr:MULTISPECIES: DedA family protein/thiosulfate sulfurtransferase GlpE [Cupriavidus]QQB79932.1 DedA family protein/thiosulfate sulfurtransferase GlpE [Cupriavidus necator]WKA44184.1 DedA family protein/thiosulfate sulfurtransferase GlpE [Cupriavidus necator]CAJ94938.1 thiosulfate sulfurtransferase [Cupriavidus necator H16]